MQKLYIDPKELLEKSTRYININDAKIKLYDSGTDSDHTLIFLHGVPGQISNWKYQIAYFKDKYRVVAFDLRGYGESDKPPRISLEEHLNDLDKIIEELSIEKSKAFLIGHSYGCIVALEYAVRNNIAGLALIGPVAEFKADFMDKIIWYLPPLVWKKLFFTMNPLTIRLYRKMFFSPSTDDKVFNDFVKDNKEYIEGLPPHVYRYTKYLVGYKVGEETSKINTPTLIIVGEDDKVTPPTHATKIHSLIKNSILKIIPGAGHLILYEKPNEINNLIEEFIDNIIK